jgi:hypothetical protein
MIPAMRFFTLALPLEVDGSPAPSPASSLTGICSKMHVDRRAVGAVVVPRRIGLGGNNDRGRSDGSHDTHNSLPVNSHEA